MDVNLDYSLKPDFLGAAWNGPLDADTYPWPVGMDWSVVPLPGISFPAWNVSTACQVVMEWFA
jgi:hypothetical protein